MSRFVFLTTLAALVIRGNGLKMGPVGGHHRPNGYAPSRSIDLSYGAHDRSLVNATLSLHHSAVVLEDIPSIKSVDCTADTVTVVFDDSDSYNAAAAAWSVAAKGLLLVTNHMGDCDAELERGFFVSTAVQQIASALTLVAQTTKSAAQDVAEAIEISFESVPAQQMAIDKRDLGIEWDPSVSIAQKVDLPSTVLFSYPPYVNVSADSASLALMATLSGRLSYNVLLFKLNQLAVDFDTQLSADLVLTAEIDAAYNKTFSYSAPPLAYYLVDIPGILQIGPDLLFSIGVDMGASGAVSVTADVGVDMPDGHLHIDYLHSDWTSASGWTPTTHATVNVTEKAEVHIDPFVDLTAELGFRVLGGLLDLSIGLDAQPRFNNTLTLTATQEITPDNVTQPNTNGTCENGLALKSDFVFNLFAKVTQFWSSAIYSVSVPIADECYTWL